MTTRIEDDDDNLHVKVATLSGRVDGIHGRVRVLEDKHMTFELFATEIKQRNNRYDGAQAAEERLQRERHESNSTKLTILGVIVAILALAVGWLTYIDTKAAVRQGVSIIPFAENYDNAANHPQLAGKD